MRLVRILGVDPGFANLGVCGVTVASNGDLAVDFVDVITTKKSNKKLGLRQYDDETRRLVEIEMEFEKIMKRFAPNIVASERFASLRSAPTTRKIALVFGAIHAIATRQLLTPLLLHEPTDIKWRICKNRKASKAEIEAAIRSMIPAFTAWPTTKKREHAFDAAGAAICSATDSLVSILHQKDSL